MLDWLPVDYLLSDFSDWNILKVGIQNNNKVGLRMCYFESLIKTFSTTICNYYIFVSHLM